MRVHRPLATGALLLAIFLDCSAEAHASLARRQEPSPSVETTSNLSGGRDTGTSTVSQNSITESTTGFVPTKTSAPATDSAIPTQSSSLNETLSHHQIPDGQLPLTPVITPGWAVAGVILLGTGVVYALIGIKTKWLHTFFSTAFLTSLGTTVLILYVMTPPVSNAIQGAYVAAVVCTGLILGVLAIVFKEVTECLGCLIGGFCLSMWLLALQPGGLVPNTGGKVALIAIFTVGGTCLYFTKWTRAYGLIGSISFTGATVAVLGIDCFSRAGLREFWAYIWALNDHLFPLGAVTYPLTRGIRVELAVTILIFLAGIVSQLKLWRIVKERRDRKEAEIAEGERSLRAEEENVGRQVEEVNARERREWERVHGNGNVRDSASQLGLSDDSGIGDMGSEKPGSSGAEDTTTTNPDAGTEVETTPSSLPAGRAPTPFPLGEGVTIDGVVVDDVTPEEGRAVTVLVAEDDTPNRPKSLVPAPEGNGTEAGSKDERTSLSVSSRTRPPVPPALTVVPLPFQVPGSASNDDSSSAATFADEDEEYGKTPLMSPSTREDSPVLVASENSERSFASLPQPQREEAREVRRAATTVETDPNLHDENDSVVANLDDLDSVDEESVGEGEASIKVAEGQAVLEPSSMEDKDEKGIIPEGKGDARRHTEEPSTEKPALSADDGSGPASTAPRDGGLSEASPVSEDPADRNGSTTTAAPIPANLTKGNLPPPLSRIAKSYRTNEWAKHLSLAEAPVPEPEPVSRPNPSDPLKSPAPSEDAVPVNVWELQQTPNNAVMPPAAPRSIDHKSVHALRQEASRDSLGVPMAATSTPSPGPEQIWTRPGHLSATSRPVREHTPPIPEDRAKSPPQPFRRLAAPINPDPPLRARSSTPFPPPRDLTPTPPPNCYTPPPQNTLIGMRETLLRNKASYGQFLPQPGDIIPMMRPESPSWPVPSDDEDDMPLSQRRAMMIRRSSSKLSGRAWSPAPATAETSTFNSHQPQRHSTAPSQAVRQAQLANFRNSVAMDLRAVNRSATPPVQGPGLVAMAVNSGRQGQGVGMVYGGGEEMGGRTRSSLMILRAENEAGLEREREREREFAVEERMRSGVMMEAHRDALRKMQRGVGGL